MYKSKCISLSSNNIDHEPHINENDDWFEWMRGQPERIAQIRKDVLNDYEVSEKVKNKILNEEISVDYGCLYGINAQGQPCRYDLKGHEIGFLYSIPH